MTHTIYLVRHGIAADAGPGEHDADRALTADGKHKLKQIAAGLKLIGVAPAVILASPLRRTRETADVLQAALEAPLGVELCAALAPGHPATEVVAELRPYHDRGEVLLVGHQPDMGELASQLLERFAQRGSRHHRDCQRRGSGETLPRRDDASACQDEQDQCRCSEECCFHS